MWMVWMRSPREEAAYWPGRRWLAALDAVIWPLAWVWVLGQAPPDSGLLAPMGTALALCAACTRLQRALWANHRYHFTAWRWGRVLVALAAFGMLLKGAVTW